MKLGRKERTTTLTEPHAETYDADSDTERGARPPTSSTCPQPSLRRERPLPTGAEPFGELLVRRGLVSEEDVAQALIVQQESGKRLGETLVDMGALNERELILVLADLLHMPVVDLRRRNPETDALALIPEQVVREHMAMPDPPRRRRPPGRRRRTSRRSPSERCLTQATDHPIRFVLAPESDIQWAIDSSYRAIGGVDKLVEAFRQSRARGSARPKPNRHRGRRRRRAHRPGRHPHPHPGQAGPRLGRPHRALTGRRPGALPHRRRARRKS